MARQGEGRCCSLPRGQEKGGSPFPLPLPSPKDLARRLTAVWCAVSAAGWTNRVQGQAPPALTHTHRPSIFFAIPDGGANGTTALQTDTEAGTKESCLHTQGHTHSQPENWDSDGSPSSSTPLSGLLNPTSQRAGPCRHRARCPAEPCVVTASQQHQPAKKVVPEGSPSLGKLAFPTTKRMRDCNSQWLTGW